MFENIMCCEKVCASGMNRIVVVTMHRAQILLVASEGFYPTEGQKAIRENCAQGDNEMILTFSNFSMVRLSIPPHL